MTTNFDDREIISYGNPPIDEVAISVQFEELNKLDFRKINVIFAEFSDFAETIEEKPPLNAQFELFDEGRISSSDARLEFFTDSMPPRRRLWFVGAGGAELVQMQSDRFIRNWRKRSESQSYPRFNQILPEFVADYRKFLSGAANAGYKKIEPNQVEVSYFNNIWLEDGLNAMNACEKYFSFIKLPRSPEIPYSEGFKAEAASVGLRYQFYEDGQSSARGRLFVDLFPATDSTGRNVLRLQLVARGRPSGTDADAVERFVRAGRREIVSMFDRLTSTEAREVWDRKQV